jgi:adenine-specific DNA-methyltransferase
MALPSNSRVVLGLNRGTREALREKGQFWTPDWVAEAMMAYAYEDGREVFDPGVGGGAFLRALRKLSQAASFYGMDNDSDVLDEGRRSGLWDSNCTIENRDFIETSPTRRFHSIIANPPYIRHHRLTEATKTKFREIALRNIGRELDGRAGIHVYFLIQALSMLTDGGRLAFIVSADICEGVYAKRLWDWIDRNFLIEGVVSFDHTATPFPGVDTNALVLLISRSRPGATLKWIRCHTTCGTKLANALRHLSEAQSCDEYSITEIDKQEALRSGLSRRPSTKPDGLFKLRDFATTMRGIATGANEFFFLTGRQVQQLGLPMEYFRRAVGRTRDVQGDMLTIDDLARLELSGRPTYLLCPPHEELSDSSLPMANYLRYGEELGLDKRALISTRNPWYKMETRRPPEFLFAYLGRRNARFIRNAASVLPLTGFLCVYSRSSRQEDIERLWEILRHPSTVENLSRVGKSYGSGAIKVEPRSLEELPIDNSLIEQIGLEMKPQSLTLF